MVYVRRLLTGFVCAIFICVAVAVSLIAQETSIPPKGTTWTEYFSKFVRSLVRPTPSESAVAEQSEAEGLCEKILDAFKGTNRNISCFPSSAFARATEARPYYILSHGRISAIESKFDDHKPFGTQISAITLSKYQSYGISDKARFSLMAVFNPKDLEKVSLKKAIAIAEPAICKKTTEFLRAGAELAVRRNVTPEANARPEANALLKFSLFGLDAQPDVKYEIYNMLCEHFQLDPEWKIYLMFDPSRAPPAQEGPIAKINPVETIGYNDKTVTAIVNFPK